MDARIAPLPAPIAAAASPAATPAEAKKPCKVFTVNSLETPAAAPPPPAAALPAGPLSARVGAPAAPGSVEASAAKVLGKLFDHERAVDKGLRAAMAGKQLSAQELLVLQAQVIQYSQEVEVASRLVDKLTGAVRQVMQTQV